MLKPEIWLEFLWDNFYLFKFIVSSTEVICGILKLKNIIY